MNKYTDIHKNLILKSSGIVHGNIVMQPGIIITQETRLTADANNLFNNLNIGHEFPHAEFNSRLTYMSFQSEKPTDSSYLIKMVRDHGHLSVFNDTYVTVLVAGVSIETELEFLAHNEATVARLTSSRTAAQSSPLFVNSIYNNEFDSIIFNTNTTLAKIKPDSKDELEAVNMLYPCSKAVSFTITMSIKDWHKTFIGRLSDNGVEKEVQEVCCRINDKLQDKYSLVIQPVKDYYKMNNSSKYKN